VSFLFFAFVFVGQIRLKAHREVTPFNLASAVCFQCRVSLRFCCFSHHALCFQLEATVFNLASIVCFQSRVSFQR
jgi:hypothetical protein